MGLADDVERIAAAAQALAAPDERVTGVLAAEPADVGRVYLCAYETGDGRRAWLALDDGGEAIRSAHVVHEAAALAALCELAAESAGGEQLDELRQRLAELREREAPDGIEDAEAAAAALADALAEDEPRLATTAWLDEVGVRSRRLELALGTASASPFATALQQALPAVEELAQDVERNYKGQLG
jgi:HPt (histidine-containing phosphotransfer) domain-containing protein